MLVGRDGEVLRVGPAVGWALTWGLGVALGVALGGWLTLVGGAGTPGAEGLDLLSDLVVFPILAGTAVAVLHLAGQLLASALRGRSVARAGE